MPETERPWTALNMVTPGYFQTAGVRLQEGRAFTPDDGRSGRVAIVNQVLAQRLWPEGGAISKRIDVMYAAGRVLEVVGVVADVKQFGLEAAPSPEIYVPAAQMPVTFTTLIMRTTVDPDTLMKPAVAAVRSLDRGQPVSRVTPMLRTVAARAAQRRFAALLLSLFGALALSLAAIGVSGIMAYTVAQRTREFGIRLALGAQRREVLRSVLTDGIRPTAIGLVIGLGGAWGLVQFLRNMLFEVEPHDPITFIATPLLLAAIALAASLLPARRAACVDPVHTLRHD